MRFVAHILSFLALGGALVLTYAAMFLYEKEERRVSDRLADWWVALHDLHGGLIPKGRVVLCKAFEIADHLLDRLLGARLVSWQAVSTSILFAAAMVSLLFFTMSFFSKEWQAVTGYGIASVLLLVTAFWHARAGRGATILIVCVFAYIAYLYFGRAQVGMLRGLEGFLESLLQLSSDFVLGLVLRITLKRLGQRKPLAAALLLPLVVGVTLSGLLVAGYYLSPMGPYGSLVMFISSLPILFFTAFVFFIPILLFVGKATLSGSDRLLYSIERFRLIHDKKRLCALAAALYGVVGVNWFAPLVNVLKDI